MIESLGSLAIFVLAAELLLVSMAVSKAFKIENWLPCVFIQIASMCTVMTVEGLSVLRMLEPAAIAFVFSAVVQAMLVLVFFNSKTRGALVAYREKCREKLSFSFEPEEYIYGLVAIFVLAVTFMVAIASPPNNWDSMTYHNARVMNWLDQKTLVASYTPNYRQVFFPPLASFFKLIIFSFTKADFLFNGIQWLFGVVAAYSVALGVRVVTKRRSMAMFGAVLALLMPGAILQSSSTQNDLVLSCFLVTAFSVFLSQLENDESNAALDYLFSASVAFAFLTKGTAVFYVSPVALLWVLSALKRRSAKRVLVLALLALAVNLPHALRVHRYFGTFKPPTSEMVTSAAWQDGVMHYGKRVVSQSLKNAVLQLDGVYPIDVARESLESGVGFLHRLIGQPIDDQRMPSKPFWLWPKIFRDEDYSGNTLHLLILIAILVASFFIRGKRAQAIRLMLALMVLQVVLFSASVAWYEYNNRLTLPIMFLGCMSIGVFFDSFKAAHRTALLLILFAYACPYLFFCETRPIFDLSAGRPSLFERTRWENYFRKRPSLRASVEESLREVAALCPNEDKTVGFRVGDDAWEYIFWVGAREQELKLRFRHLKPDEIESGQVCAVIEEFDLGFKSASLPKRGYCARAPIR